ncbi:glycosyltransferase family 9 protein [bacterium]|jgi:heptosyltransferase-2|nr:glycosyltransferase family 9 protein [bacterium]
MTPEKILIRAPNWIGDQILAYPFYYYLRKGYPRAKITVACSSWVQDVMFRDLVDEVYVLPKVYRGTLSEKFQNLEKAAGQLKKGWDLAITLPNSLSAAWLLKRTGASRRRGYSMDARGWLLNEKVHWDKKHVDHRSQAYVNLLPIEIQPRVSVQSFWPQPSKNDLDLGVEGEVSSFFPEHSWPDFEVAEPLAEPYWILAPGSMAESRRWPAEYFASFAARVSSETGWPGIIVGGPKEVSLAQTLIGTQGTDLRDYTGRVPVPGLWKLFRNAKFSLCNDSGLAHVAAICGSFTHIVWGGGDPKRTVPLGPGRVQMTVNPVDCWPCEHNQCFQPAGQNLKCLRSIQPERVWDEIQVGLQLKKELSHEQLNPS